jgi:multicomponent K+:H+ antiporter subunit D
VTHSPILPILIPFGAAVLCLLVHRMGSVLKRAIGLTSVLALAVSAVDLLTSTADGTIQVYRLGNWAAPYGIVLVVDRLSAAMVALVAIVSVPALLCATAGTDENGRHFHVLFQFQIVGLNGAFLTGDLFNLFVFFEILLLASYALLLHGGGLARARAGLAYVVLNLSGSALFLIALGLLYGTLGTLNLADMAVVLNSAAPADQALVRTAAALLVAVFLLKAALVPVSFWLPHTYGAASAPVAALFAIMTKVGIYALLRVSSVAFASAPFTADLLGTWLPALALLTVALGVVGILAASRFRTIVSNLILVSTGTLVAAIAASTPAATAAALYYLPHTTLVTAGLFLLGDAIARERGAAGDALAKGPRLAAITTLGGAYLVLALAASGLPPLSGFIGKLMLMQSLFGSPFGPAIWVALAASSFAVTLVLARTAAVFFWEPSRSGESAVAPPQPRRRTWVALLLLAASSPVLAVASGPVSDFAQATAEQVHARDRYIGAVLGTQPNTPRELRP